MTIVRKNISWILLATTACCAIGYYCWQHLSQNVDVPLKLMRAEDIVSMEAETNGAWYRIEPVKRFVVPSRFHSAVYKYLSREFRTWMPASKAAIRKYQLGIIYLEGKDGTRNALEFYTTGNGATGLSNDGRFYISDCDDREDGGQSLLLLLNDISSNLKKTN